MTEAQVGWEEYIPTDKWSLQDWYLMKLVKLDAIYTRLMRGHYGGGIDRRSMVDFYAEVRAYQMSAMQNMSKHLSEAQSLELRGLVEVKPDAVSLEGANKIMVLLSAFHWKSGLSKLSESRPIGDMARARANVGMITRPVRDDY